MFRHIKGIGKAFSKATVGEGEEYIQSKDFYKNLRKGIIGDLIKEINKMKPYYYLLQCKRSYRPRSRGQWGTIFSHDNKSVLNKKLRKLVIKNPNREYRIMPKLELKNLD